MSKTDVRAAETTAAVTAEFPPLDTEIAEAIEIWKDRRRRAKETRALASEDNAATFALCGTMLLEAYLDQRLAGPNPFMQDGHVHPDLKAATLAVLNRLSSLRTHQVERMVNGKNQVVETFEVGTPMPIRRPDGRKFALFVHPVLLRVNPDINAEPSRIDGPRPGEVGVFELPRNPREFARHQARTGGRPNAVDLGEPEIS